MGRPAGKPSMMATNPLPCDSPAVVKLKCIAVQSISILLATATAILARALPHLKTGVVAEAFTLPVRFAYAAGLALCRGDALPRTLRYRPSGTRIAMSAT